MPAMPSRYGKRLAYAGGLVLAASFVGGAILGRSEPPASSDAKEPELFSFIRAFPERAVDAADDNSGAPDPIRAALPALRGLFDNVLVLHADAPLDVARTHVERELKARFRSDIHGPAMAMFDRYARYQRESMPVHAQVDAATDLAGLRSQLNALDMLRARHFTPGELSGLFPADHAFDRMLLAQMEIRENAALSEDQRLAQWQALEASIPAEVRAVEDTRSLVIRADLQRTARPVDGEEDVYRIHP